MSIQENVESAKDMMMGVSEKEVGMGMVPQTTGGSSLTDMMKVGGSKLEYSSFGGKSRKRRNSKKAKKAKKNSKSKKNRKSKK
uniref:Uncharacterized protein n=1 Tax=viral metagenome TaxID=1070528 RepID=A0A6C0IB91_9ZZZZ